MTFLKSSVSDLSNTYYTALLAYTLSLAGEDDLRFQLLRHLESVATSDGMKHFSVPDSCASRCITKECDTQREA